MRRVLRVLNEYGFYCHLTFSDRDGSGGREFQSLPKDLPTLRNNPHPQWGWEQNSISKREQGKILICSRPHFPTQRNIFDPILGSPSSLWEI